MIYAVISLTDEDFKKTAHSLEAEHRFSIVEPTIDEKSIRFRDSVWLHLKNAMHMDSLKAGMHKMVFETDMDVDILNDVEFKAFSAVKRIKVSLYFYEPNMREDISFAYKQIKEAIDEHFTITEFKKMIEVDK